MEHDEAIESVLGHAALHLLVLDADTADRVRRALRGEAIDDPSLANDPDRVARLVERYAQVVAQSRDVQPIEELGL